MKFFITILTFTLFSFNVCAGQTESTQTESTQTQSTQTSAPDTTKPRAVVQTESEKTAVKTSDVKQENDSATATPKTYELTFDDIKFEMEKGGEFSRTMLTPEIRTYHNSIVTLRGFIKPLTKQSGLKKFVFVRDNKECCFGPGAALYDCVLVQLTKGTTTDFTVRPVTVTGKFYVKEYRIAGKIWAVFRMKDTTVR